MKKMFLAAALMAVVSLANAQAPANAPYGVKSGVYTMSMAFGDNEMITEYYFDNYGLKTAQVQEGGGMMGMGQEGKTRTITDKDGATIRINDEAKTATKFPAGGPMGGFGGGRAQINWNNLTDQVKKDNNIKELGKETIAGKECTKYSMTTEGFQGPQEQTVWIYKGIQLKNEMSSDFGTFGATCKKFEEKDVPASMFEVPAGVKVEEFDMSQFGGFGGF
jgi:opacity protein-like surface antigen